MNVMYTENLRFDSKNEDPLLKYDTIGDLFSMALIMNENSKYSWRGYYY
jgi:hypothetical protein